MIAIQIPGAPTIRLEHLTLDVNGTLTCEGALIDGVEARLGVLQQVVSVQLISADTYGTVDALAARLGVTSSFSPDAASKLRLVERLGSETTAHIGNGSNDVDALRGAALGMVVVGPEGTSTAALLAGDVVFASITDALDALLQPRRLTATLRGMS